MVPTSKVEATGASSSSSGALVEGLFKLLDKFFSNWEPHVGHSRQ